MPRTEDIPKVICRHNSGQLTHRQELSPLSPIPSSGAASSGSSPTTSTASPSEETSTSDDSKLALAAGGVDHEQAAASNPEAGTGSRVETDLRKSIVKSRLAAADLENLPRSDSMDSMLGDSLLDPPQSLQKIPPKRYQSPSRCGSPSLEAPDHLLFGHSHDSAAQAQGQNQESNQSRLARQDLLRRRDINLYSGLHPRLLHAQQQMGIQGQPLNQPRLSLLPNRGGTIMAGPPRPYRAFPSASTPSPQMPTPLYQQQQLPLSPSTTTTTSPVQSSNSNNTPSSPMYFDANSSPAQPCTRSGKHMCSGHGVGDGHQEGGRNLGAKKKTSHSFKKEDFSSDDDEDVVAEVDGVLPDDQALIDEILFESLRPKSNCSSRRSSLKDEESILFPHKCGDKKKKKAASRLMDDILGNPHANLPADLVTQVYRAEIPPLPPMPSQPQESQNIHDDKSEEGGLSKSDILLGAILRTGERNRHLEEDSDIEQLQSPLKIPASRLRTVSDNPDNYRIDPLDLTLGSPKDGWSDEFDDDEASEEEEDEEGDDVEDILERPPSSRRSSFSDAAGHYVPTPDECVSFRQSFDSATAMVFHKRTGLPLTSSPAPLRRGHDKFDYDDSITSPLDIKKALFAKKKSLPPALAQTLTQNNNVDLLDDGSNNKENCFGLNASVPPLVSNKQEVPEKNLNRKKRERRPSKKLLSASAPATLTSNNLLGNFEESVLNGRLEPNSTVEGFTAEIGASGSFHPKHRTLPVTVFFYTLCDNATYSSPYLGK